MWNAIEMDDGLAMVERDEQLVLQTINKIRNLCKLVESLQLAQHIHRLLHSLPFVRRYGHLGYRIVVIGIAIILMFIYLDGRIEAQLVGPHHLYISLNRTHRHTLADTLHLIESI